MRGALGGMLVAGLVVAAVASSGSTAGATGLVVAPKVTTLTANPSELPRAGGKVDLTGKVAHATTCTWSVVPTAAIKGLPTTAECTSGKIADKVKVPGHHAASRRLVFTLTAKGASGEASRKVTVVQSLLSITTATLPEATDGQAYSQQLQASGGAPPYSWSVAHGSTLPSWLTLSPTGQLSGTPSPSAAGSKVSFRVQVADDTGLSTARSISLAVGAGSAEETIVSTGDGYCAVLSSGAVDCWGANFDGELGDGTSTGPQTCDSSQPCSTVPVAVPGLSGVTSLASDGSGSCALLSSGGVDCWGANEGGELGDGTNSGPQACESFYGSVGCSAVPVAVPGLSGVTSVASDGNDYCALLSSGGVDCWGANMDGDLGDGTSTGPQTCEAPGYSNACSTAPVAVSGLSGVTSLASEQGAGSGYCAVLSSGAVDCWGGNQWGQLGDGTSSGPQTCGGSACSTVPVAVPNLSGVISITGDGYGAGYCAVLSSGAVDCWGDNSFGELGNGDTTGPQTCGDSPCSTVPVAVSGLRGVSSLASDGTGYCTLLSSGGVDCWGANAFGAVGDGTSTGPQTCDNSQPCSTVPVAVPGLSGVTSLASDGTGDGSGADYCAVLSSGAVDCWGYNVDGELGDGTSSGPQICGGSACSTVPVAVLGLSGVTGLTSDGFGDCAVLSSGAVDCWGYNAFGELGDGTTEASDVPANVVGLGS